MTRIATEVNRVLRPKPVYKGQVWWSFSNCDPDIATVIDAAFSPVLPGGSIIREIRLCARPFIDVWAIEGIVHVVVVQSDQLTNSQVVESAPLIDWINFSNKTGWTPLGKFPHEEWICCRKLSGANNRIAFLPEAYDNNGVWANISVRWELP